MTPTEPKKIIIVSDTRTDLDQLIKEMEPLNIEIRVESSAPLPPPPALLQRLNLNAERHSQARTLKDRKKLLSKKKKGNHDSGRIDEVIC